MSLRYRVIAACLLFITGFSLQAYPVDLSGYYDIVLDTVTFTYNPSAPVTIITTPRDGTQFYREASYPARGESHCGTGYSITKVEIDVMYEDKGKYKPC